MATKKTPKKTSNRPKPNSPRAGFKASGNRYGCGGSLKKSGK